MSSHCRVLGGFSAVAFATAGLGTFVSADHHSRCQERSTADFVSSARERVLRGLRKYMHAVSESATLILQRRRFSACC